MIKLNDNSIYVGQIKQLLHTFNLPQCQVGNVYPKPNTHFLLKDNIMYWDSDNNVHFSDKYVYGQDYLNLTSNLPIRNILYDRETHQYLGKYLRFLRDYSGINLMSMYNCCDGNVNTNELSFILREGEPNEKTVSFKSGANNCTVYKVPVSISNYTIATHCQAVVEICVYIENTRAEYEDLIIKVAKSTYIKRKINNNFIYNPFDRVIEEDVSKFLLSHADEIKLLIKLTENFNTSLVVLEGEYLSDSRHAETYYTYKPVVSAENPEPATLLAYYQVGETLEPSTLLALDSNGIWDALLGIAEAATQSDDTVESRFDITAQLLSIQNTNSSYLLADRLVEYLSGNVITPINESYEIQRVQQMINVLRANNSIKGNLISIPHIAKHRANYSDYIRRSNPKKTSYSYGVWHYTTLQDLRGIAIKNNLHHNYDCLGYLDKDMENILKGVIDNVEL